VCSDLIQECNASENIEDMNEESRKTLNGYKDVLQAALN
jgi:hypothetical protein